MHTKELFKDLKVLELASVLAGPAVGMFFAELGAQVTKIENKRAGGDITRRWRLGQEAQNTPVSAYYCSVNYNKKVLMLDLNSPEDRQIVYGLVKETDIVIANFKKSSAERLSMDYNSLSAINPQLIYGNISGFGEDSKRVAFDVVLQAESGFMFMNGQAQSPPTKMPVALIDLLAAHHLKEGILVAMIQAMKYKKGAYVSVSLLDAAITSLANQATNWLMNAHIPVQMGSEHPNIAPYGDLFQTADGIAIVLAIGSDVQFQKFCAFINRIDIAENELYKTNIQRVTNRRKLYDELSASIQRIQSKALFAYCHAQQIPVGRIRNMQEVFETEAAQQLILEQQIEGMLTKRVSTIAFRF